MCWEFALCSGVNLQELFYLKFYIIQIATIPVPCNYASLRGLNSWCSKASTARLHGSLGTESVGWLVYWLSGC